MVQSPMQAISCWPLTVEVRVHTQVRIPFIMLVATYMSYEAELLLKISQHIRLFPVTWWPGRLCCELGAEHIVQFVW
jgi:hypothetical protein